MELKGEDLYNKLLCRACLCVGRTVFPITDENLKKYYLDALDEIPLSKPKQLSSLIVCWECRALLQKCWSFREQVKDSYRILQTYTSENLHECLLSDVSRPPHLKVHVVDSISIIPTYAEFEVSIAEFKDELADDWDCGKDDTSNHLDDNSLNTDTNIGDNSMDDKKELETELRTIMRSIEKEEKGEKRKKKKKIKSLNTKDKAKRQKYTDNMITIELSYEEMLSEREKEATRETYTKLPYKCESCLVGFNYKKSYQAHVDNKHSPERGEYCCPVCKTIFSTVESFTTHYKRHIRRYECTICHKRTTDLKTMQQHYYLTHEITLKEYTCNVCGKVSNSLDIHRYHTESHKQRLQCPDCDKTFRHRAGLMNHRHAVHEFNNTFPCTQCDKVFRWRTSLRRHFEEHTRKNKTTTEAPSCSMCRISFASICSYRRHLRNSLKHVSQDQLRFICDHCNRRFSDKTKLRDHIEEKHLHKTFQCHICLKMSKNRVGLDQHIRNVHKGRPKDKMCHHCGRGFPTRMQLDAHIRMHTGERPFICEFCPTTFSQQSNLNKHNKQVHLNIKSKRYPNCKKKKEGSSEDTNIPKVPVLNQVEDFRPVLQYSPERGFVI
ncbi:uncharacterized protein LOC142985660 [Anticarsia gemmatalis]|uniref:uncharacterized protein LOC142985660 n=1 Tax=Anticarsia gemmatalis TaxID=129554 RepID=UPI003F75B85E